MAWVLLLLYLIGAAIMIDRAGRARLPLSRSVWVSIGWPVWVPREVLRAYFEDRRII